MIYVMQNMYGSIVAAGPSFLLRCWRFVACVINSRPCRDDERVLEINVLHFRYWILSIWIKVDRCDDRVPVGGRQSSQQ